MAGRGYSLREREALRQAGGRAKAAISPEDIVDGAVTKVTVADPGTGYEE